MHFNKKSKGDSEQRTRAAKVCFNGQKRAIFTPWMRDAMRFRPNSRRIDIEAVVDRAQNRRLFIL